MQLELDSQDLSPNEVRRRFHWAKRQGNPAWLWPDVTVEDWRDALRRIEDAARAALSGGEGRPVLDGDPAAIGLACYTSGVGPLLGWWVEEGLLSASPAIARLLELHLRHNRLRAARMEAAGVALIEALVKQGITVAVLKGAHTAGAYFPDPGARPASDIDLLVPATQAPAAEAVIQSLGFVFESRGPRESSWRLAGAAREPRSLMLAHCDDPWSVDLHSSLDVFTSPGAPLARLDAADPLASRRPWPPSPGAVVLKQPVLLLHLAVHAGSGLQNLTLLRLIELTLVIRKDLAEGRLSWDEFLAAGERTQSLGYAYLALRLCEDLAPDTTPGRVLEQCAQRAPKGVLRVASRLSPATAQRIDGVSLAEHFMWANGWGGWLRQLVWDVAPSTGSWKALRAIYEKRAWRLIRGTFSR